MTTRISPPDKKALAFAKEEIARGGVVAFHTETVYGLGANAFDDRAVAKIFALKGRPADNPLIVHVHKDYDFSALVDFIPPYAKALARAYLPGPLTMVYPSAGKVSPSVSCGLNTLAVRVPSSPTAQAFLRAVGLPIAAPSANKSKHVSPVTAGHVYDDFQGEIPLILDGGACSGGIESTVLDCTGEVPQILRAGLVTREMIAAVAGDCTVYRMRANSPKAPVWRINIMCPSAGRSALRRKRRKRRDSVTQKNCTRAVRRITFANALCCPNLKGTRSI